MDEVEGILKYYTSYGEPDPEFHTMEAPVKKHTRSIKFDDRHLVEIHQVESWKRENRAMHFEADRWSTQIYYKSNVNKNFEDGLDSKYKNKRNKKKEKKREAKKDRQQRHSKKQQQNYVDSEDQLSEKKRKNSSEDEENEENEDWEDTNNEEEKQEQEQKQFELKDFKSIPIRTLEEHKDWVQCLIVVKEKYILTAGDDCILNIWKMQKEDNFENIQQNTFENEIKTMHYNEQHNSLLVGFGNGKIQVFENFYEEKQEQENEQEEEKKEDEQKKLSSSKKKVVFNLKEQENENKQIVDIHKDSVNFIAYLKEYTGPDEQDNVKGGGSKKKGKNKKHQKYQKVKSESQQVNQAYLSSSLDGKIFIWSYDNQEQKQLQEFKGHDEILQSNSLLRIRTDKFLTVCSDKKIRLFSLYNQEAIFDYESKIEGLSSIGRASPQDEVFIRQFVVGGESEIVFFEMNNQFTDFAVFMKVSDAHTSFINCIIQLEDNVISTCSHDMSIKIWEIDEEELQVEEAKKLQGHTDDITNIYCVNQYLISLSSDKSVQIWK